MDLHFAFNLFLILRGNTRILDVRKKPLDN